jgi:hypothetical protein
MSAAASLTSVCIFLLGGFFFSTPTLRHDFPSSRHYTWQYPTPYIIQPTSIRISTTDHALAKMVQQQGIDVYLAPFGKIDQRYPEHPAPVSSTSTTADIKDVYIEAVDADRFVVVVDFGKDFDGKVAAMIPGCQGSSRT